MQDSKKINELLKQEPEFDQILHHHKKYHKIQDAINIAQDSIKSYQDDIKRLKEAQELEAQQIKELLIALEDKTGFSKAPDVAHLMQPANTYSVDIDACPEEYIRVKREVDMMKIKKDVKEGILTPSNWLTENIANRVVVIK